MARLRTTVGGCQSRTSFGQCCARARSASGLTILELLVVATSLTTLMSLLLPAVSASREGSRNQQCVHQLGQISAALHAYEEIHLALPAGWNLERTKTSGYGW